MTTKHTSFPWTTIGIVENGGYLGTTAGIEVGPVTLDGSEYGQEPGGLLTDKQRERMEADARLIECIPDMLEALDQIAKGGGVSSGNPYAIARNAINKVKGGPTS